LQHQQQQQWRRLEILLPLPLVVVVLLVVGKWPVGSWQSMAAVRQQWRLLRGPRGPQLLLLLLVML
jgi:hypothetical protein